MLVVFTIIVCIILALRALSVCFVKKDGGETEGISPPMLLLGEGVREKPNKVTIARYALERK
jgi:hypothetical protein